MKMLIYFKSLTSQQKAALAEELGTSVQYLSQIAHDHRKASHTLAKNIERSTNKQVTRHDLRSDIFGPPPGFSDPPAVRAGHLRRSGPDDL